MAKYPAHNLNATFAALADPTRRAILEQLAEGPKSVGKVAEQFDFALPTVSRHIRVLEQAGLIDREKRGRVHYLHLNTMSIWHTMRYLLQYGAFWQETFRLLDDFLTQQADEDQTDDRPDTTAE